MSGEWGIGRRVEFGGGKGESCRRGDGASAGRADCLPRRKSMCFLADYGPKGCRGRAESPLPATLGEAFAESSPPWRGLTRRLRRGERACSPMGRSIVSVGDPKGTGGNEGKRVPSGHNRRRRLATRSSGKQQAERTAVRAAPIVCPEESPQCARRRILLPSAGNDAPTPARIGTGRPKGRSHFSFGGERKVCKRKPAARRLREKGFYCPF